MTLEQAMVRLAVTFYGTFTVVFLVGMLLGALLMWCVAGRRRKPALSREWDIDEALEAWAPVFEPGVARVGDR